MAVSRVKTSSILQGFPKSRSLLAGNTAYDPAATWLIQRITPSGGATTVTFSSIPQTYKHLQIRAICKDTYATGNQAASYNIRFNSDSGANYTYHYLRGNGSTVSAGASTGTTSATIFYGAANSGTSVTNVFGTSIVDIHDYTSTAKYKTVRSFAGADGNGVSTTSFLLALSSNLWLNTAAISTITIIPDITAFATGTTFALYGMVG
jgi:hypothetical protein